MRFHRPTHRPDFDLYLQAALEEAGFELLLADLLATGRAEGPAQKFRTALDAVPDGTGSAPCVTRRSLIAAYEGEPVSPREDQQERPKRAPPDRVLVLPPGLAAAELKRLRRALALANHPDRVPAELREEASRFMAAANAQIDRALKREGRG